MGKKSKTEKLKQILSELRKLKGEFKSLSKQQANLAIQVGKLSTKKPAAKPARRPAKKTQPAPPAAKKATAPKRPRPVLVSPPALTPPPTAKAAGN